MTNETIKLKLSKIDVGKRQLETAITLYFHNMDPVSVHTLAAASNEVLHGIGKSKGVQSFIKSAVGIKPGMERKWLNIVRSSENFFKHGVRDTDEIHEFVPESTEFLIYDACWMYKNITTEYPKLMNIFIIWFSMRHSDYLIKPEHVHILEGAGQVFDFQNRGIFFNQASGAYDTLHNLKLGL